MIRISGLFADRPGDGPAGDGGFFSGRLSPAAEKIPGDPGKKPQEKTRVGGGVLGYEEKTAEELFMGGEGPEERPGKGVEKFRRHPGIEEGAVEFQAAPLLIANEGAFLVTGKDGVRHGLSRQPAGLKRIGDPLTGKGVDEAGGIPRQENPRTANGSPETARRDHVPPGGGVGNPHRLRKDLKMDLARAGCLVKVPMPTEKVSPWGKTHPYPP